MEVLIYIEIILTNSKKRLKLKTYSLLSSKKKKDVTNFELVKEYELKSLVFLFTFNLAPTFERT